MAKRKVLFNRPVDVEWDALCVLIEPTGFKCIKLDNEALFNVLGEGSVQPIRDLLNDLKSSDEPSTDGVNDDDDPDDDDGPDVDNPTGDDTAGAE